MSYERKTVDRDTSKSRTRKLWDTLQNGFSQTVETVTRQSRFEISGGGVDQIDAPQDLDEFAAYARNTGIVRKSLRKFTDDVWEPGYRVEGPDQTVAYFMGEQEELNATPPEDTPEGGFLKNAGVFAGEKHQEFYDIGKESTWQRWVRGTVLIELLKAEDENPESEITGFYFIRPETVSAEVYPNTNILIDPDDTDVDGVEITKREEAAAYIQFDDESILGRRGRLRDDEEIPLSQNDVHKQVLEPDIGDDPGMQQGVFGTSIIEAINDEIAEYKQIKRDRAAAIQTKAYGVWAMEFGRDVLDVGENQKEIIEWDDDSMDDQVGEIGTLEPGQIAAYDGTINLKKFESEVPELVPTLNQYVDEILSALPTPKYKIGFEDNVNRDVTSEQNTDYNQTVAQEREYQERQWSQVLRTVAERKGLPTEGLKLKIEPEPSDNPLKSMSSEEIEDLATYANAIAAVSGQGGPQTLLDRETLVTEVLQLPDSVLDGESLEELPEPDADTMAHFRETMGLDVLQFDDGSVVDTPDGFGIIDDIITEGTIDGDEATEDDPIYAVVVEDESVGVGFYREDELSEGELPPGGPDNPEEDIQTEDDSMAYDAYQRGFFNWPESWKESETPARIIALKAWAGMGGSFTGCVREMAGNVSRPNAFCADFKDRIYGTERWRGGWTD